MKFPQVYFNSFDYGTLSVRINIAPGSCIIIEVLSPQAYVYVTQHRMHERPSLLASRMTPLYGKFVLAASEQMTTSI